MPGPLPSPQVWRDIKNLCSEILKQKNSDNKNTTNDNGLNTIETEY